VKQGSPLKDKNGDYTDAYFFAYLNKKPRIVKAETYFLQFGIADNVPSTPSGIPRTVLDRPFIDTHLHQNVLPIREVIADSWIQAKQRLI
jgi:hypothetical protein